MATKAKPFYVMIATSTGENRCCETRYGRFFASIDRATSLAERIGGSVYERTPVGHARLRLDAFCGFLRGAK